ncbi:YcaO-like family protein [Roseibium sp.]|uniref:YcaO-like family protein n=1 Tax=Roseibium sp. TaxID=1936156 RepID=UPI003B51E423
MNELSLELPDGSNLNGVADYIQDIFCIDLPYAPGMVFVGAQFQPAKGMEAISAGAADIDPQRALERCFGEIAETLSQYTAFKLDSTKIQEILPLATSDDLSAEFEALGSHLGEDGWVAGLEVLSQAECFIPASLCFRDLKGQSETETAFSSGFAAGPTLSAAIEAATLELIERDAVALWWYGGRPPRSIAAPFLDQAKLFQRVIRKGRGDRQTVLLDLSTDIEVPVVAAVSANADGGDVAFGYAARRSFSQAIEAALKELAQMELGSLLCDLKVQSGKTDRLTPADFKVIKRRQHLSLGSAPFVCAPRECGLKPTDQDADIDAALQNAGLRRFVVEMTSPQIGVPVARVVCPQLQPLPVVFASQRLTCAQTLYNGWSDTVVVCEPI